MVAAAVADPAVKPPNTSLFPVPTFTLVTETVYVLPILSETVAAPFTESGVDVLRVCTRSARTAGAPNKNIIGNTFHIGLGN